MGTAEIIVVFSALMALVALMTIGIDWIGKPLKHRRFIPRMYRFEDEKLPIDNYGHTDFALQEGPAPGHPLHASYVQPTPVVVARVPEPTQVAASAGAAATVATPAVTGAMVTAATASSSAFSDSLLASTSGSTPVVDADQWLAQGLVPNPAEHAPAASRAQGWHPGMALDTTINDRKPNLAAKAQRFWVATADSTPTGSSHFDSDDLARMADGKPPRRSNPRSGRSETMQLTGLRQASQPGEVRMRWPEDSIDPWNAS